MSANRTDIATAATVVGVTSVTPFYRQSLKPGDGFVRLARRERDSSGFGWMDTWEVWIALPSSLVDAEKWLDEHLDNLAHRLNAAMVVTAATPSELGLGDSTVNGLIISGACPV